MRHRWLKAPGNVGELLTGRKRRSSNGFRPDLAYRRLAYLSR